MNSRTRISPYLMLAALLLGAPTAAAYVTQTTDTGAELHWAQGATIPWYVDPSGVSTLDLRAVQDTLGLAFDTWFVDQDCHDLGFQRAGTSPATISGTIRVRFEESAWTGDPGARARVEITADVDTGSIGAATIVFNAVDHQWSAPGAAEGTDLRSEAVRQIGHALGLDSSRDRASALFFAGPSTPAQGLAQDDLNALCYLYGAGGAQRGVACDSCLVDADCVSGTCEYRVADAGHFCATGCSADAECPAGTTCDGGVCAPTHGGCRSGAGEAPSGAFCWGEAMCALDLVCHPTLSTAYCAGLCTRSDACASGGTCASGVCAAPGTAQLGSTCVSDTDCASLRCLDPAGSPARCTRSCSASSCPADMACTDVGGELLCVAPGAGAIGDVCASAAGCASLDCRDLGRPRGLECTASCAPTECAAGASCMEIEGASLCVGPGRVTLGGACSGPLGALLCETLVCADTPAGSRCSRACDGACPSGCACDDRSLCVPPSAVEPSPAVEQCDGLDQNCNGLVDEEFGVGGVCEISEPGCTSGVTACAGDGLGSECVQAVDCGDGDACTVDTCDGAGGCDYRGVVCDDMDACTIDTCHPLLGCESIAIPDCATAEAPETPETCGGLSCADGNPCTIDLCDATLGCVHTAVVDGASCSDADLCNGIETCQLGLCTNGKAPQCDDGIPCTADSCSPTSGCSSVVRVDGASCADGDVCNGDETCLAGECLPGEAVECDDGEPCTLDLCSPVGGCVTAALPDGTVCNDGDFCNGVESCLSGRCEAAAQAGCEDENPCTIDVCDEALGCIFLAAEDGLLCPDDDACNGVETCQAAECRPSEPLVCDDEMPCTIDLCDKQLGCVTAIKPNGSGCLDDNLCNGAETCQQGQCEHGSPLSCDDGNPCTTDSCAEVAGCVNAALPDGIACGVADLCVSARMCEAGQCIELGPTDCDDGNACTQDHCVADKGCVNVMPTQCDDGDPCTVDSCDSSTGCFVVPASEGASCSDGNACNGAETCQAGECRPDGPSVTCDDGDPCTSDSCDPGTGECLFVELLLCQRGTGLEPTGDSGDDLEVDDTPTPIAVHPEPSDQPFGGEPTVFDARQAPASGCTATGSAIGGSTWVVVLMMLLAWQYTMLSRRKRREEIREQLQRMLSAKIIRRDRPGRSTHDG